MAAFIHSALPRIKGHPARVSGVDRCAGGCAFAIKKLNRKPSISIDMFFMKFGIKMLTIETPATVGIRIRPGFSPLDLQW